LSLPGIDLSPVYVFRPSKLHGLGVFATRRLVLGDVIMVEDPVLEGLMGNFTPWGLAALDAKLTSDFEKLDPNTQVGTWRLGARRFKWIRIQSGPRVLVTKN
jgi:hypothetical protein